MFATHWKIAWTTLPVRVWKQSGLAVQVSEHGIELSRSLHSVTIPRQDVRSIVATGRWGIRTRLRLKLTSDRAVQVVGLWRPGMLLADDWVDGHADWMNQLGAALADELCVPFHEEWSAE